GRERSLSITSMPVKNKEGKIIHGLLLIQDVTDKIKLEKKLARAESLAMVGEIAAGVAHEIRNPLESIVSASSLLSSENPNITREDHAKLTDVVKSESQRLNKLLTDFLDFTRPKEPKLNINNINELIEEVLSFSKYGEILNDGIRLRKNLDPAMTAIPIDGDMIKQVLWNIILNALQAMEKGGDLSIDSKLCEETIEVCITDSGPGVSKKEMEKLFVPFYTKRKGGTGLGLSIANRIINAHNGSIKVERTRKQGLKFTITLPKS
ncbi:MAG: ATP-binding protein, partial [Nitrospinota bacterium]|nr:ATP-binding protein [Nitrospinota bacterium]